MNHAELRRELVAALTAACAPTAVIEEEPDVVTQVTVVVVWTGCRIDPKSVSWVHRFEERIILPSEGLAAPHFAERDRLVPIVARKLNGWEPMDSNRQSSRPELDLGEVQVGGTRTKAVICRHQITEPLEPS